MAFSATSDGHRDKPVEERIDVNAGLVRAPSSLHTMYIQQSADLSHCPSAPHPLPSRLHTVMLIHFPRGCLSAGSHNDVGQFFSAGGLPPPFGQQATLFSYSDRRVGSGERGGALYLIEK